MAPVIETFNLSKTYVRDVIGVEYGRLRFRLRNRRVDALKDLNLKVEEGEIFGLLGPNGAGKTTAIKILMGIHFATRGSARIMGRSLGDKAVKAQIGFLPENPYFYDYLLGWEFLDYYGQLYGMPKQARRKRMTELLEQVGLTGAANLPLKGYSKGMLQRIGLAQALLNDPKVVFLDEPQSGLDPIGRKEVRDLILHLKDRGKTVFFSSHILSDAEMICDRVGIIFKGELQNLGRLSELLSAKIKDTEVVMSGLKSETVDRFSAQAQKVLRGENDVLFVFDKQETASSLVREGIGEGASLVSLMPRKESLEEYFIRSVQGEKQS
ncbi:MAG: ABC transporter ATP-binding protein [bacterium]